MLRSDAVTQGIQRSPNRAMLRAVGFGDEDFGNGPDMARAIANDISDAEVHILTGLRHMALAENPMAVTLPILRFLSAHLRTPETGQRTQGNPHD